MSIKQVPVSYRDGLAMGVAVEANRKLGRTSPDWMVKAAKLVRDGSRGVTLVVTDGLVEVLPDPSPTESAQASPTVMPQQAHSPDAAVANAQAFVFSPILGVYKAQDSPWSREATDLLYVDPTGAVPTRERLTRATGRLVTNEHGDLVVVLDDEPMSDESAEADDSATARSE